MAGPKPVRPLSTKGSLEKSSDGNKSKKKNIKKSTTKLPSNDDTESKKNNVNPSKMVKDSVVVKLDPSQIEDAVTAFSKLLELNSAETAEKSLFATEGQKVSLQISGIKLPRDSESQVIKVKLPHSPLPDSKDVCLFVKDLEKGLKVDHESTVQHFTNLLADKGVTGVSKVISLRELKVEYKQYEAKNQLCHMYDQFLADDRIIRLLPQFLGKPFYKRKKLPIQVNLSAKDLPGEFEKCLKTTTLPLKNTGSCGNIVVGMSTLTTAQLIENTKTIVQKLEEKYPGGWINIRSIHINSGSTSIPLYASFRSTAEVGLVRGGKKPSRAVVVDELSTVVGGTVVVTPFGTVKVKRKADPAWTEKDDDTLKELVLDENQHSKEEGEDDVDTENNQEDKSKEKERKVKKQKLKSQEEESEDEMEDKEMEYMKKVADEEEEMEKQLEENEDKLTTKLKADDEEQEDSEEEVDDDAEAENLLSEGESSDSDEELIMKNVAEDDEEEEQKLIKKKKSKKLEKSKKASKISSNTEQPQQKRSKKDKKKKKAKDAKK